jgi:beta-galactosidase
MKLGVCYYPEHWPEAWWDDDARRMAALGLTFVRIGEFAWSRIEPEPGCYEWAWLDRAVETLHAQRLRIVLGTPTATPPKWLVDRNPAMLAVDSRGRTRAFGSRRHYCFSSESYRAECARIVEAMAERYGRHPGVAAWQTDNEFGCHDTTISYSANAAHRFRRWLEQRYGDVGKLNAAWGNVFWSMEYRSFEEIDPPAGTVTEANPSHRLDYNRFASDEVVSFNRAQTEILRRLSPGRDIIHNFMGFYTEFDHFEVGRDLDVASWDSYPLGFLEQFWFPASVKARYLRQGHPDIAAFHHDLYRACGRGRWWVMEQQPGPVNWARFNPAPLAGMVRAWTWEAFAHGAEVVSYFRWRQAPFAQEQMHAGLHLPDRSEDVAAGEARQVAREIGELGALATPAPASVAVIFSYESAWMTDIQPQGAGFTALRATFDVYSALRARGLDVDILPPGADLTGYRLVFAPMVLHANEEFLASVQATDAVVVLGPRTGSKTGDFGIPESLPPGALQSLLPVSVTRVESLRPGALVAAETGGKPIAASLWREWIRSDLVPRASFADGGGAWYSDGRFHYLAGWPDEGFMDALIKQVASEAGLSLIDLPEGLRLSRRDGVTFCINFAPEPREAPAPDGATFLIGERRLTGGGVAAWRQA